MAEYTINLQLGINNDIDTLIRSKQLDAGSRFLNIQLLDDAAPLNLTRHTARFNALTPDGRYIWNDATLLDAVNGVIQVELTNQTLLESGTLVADISIYDYRQRQILTTRTFEVDIQATVRNDDAVMASNEYNAVQVLFQDVRELRDTINETHTNIGDKDSPSGTATVFGWLKKYYDYMTTHSAESAVALVNTLLGVPNPTTASSDTVFNYLRRIYERRPLVYAPSITAVHKTNRAITVTNPNNGIDIKETAVLVCLGEFTPAYDGYVNIGVKATRTGYTTSKRYPTLGLYVFQHTNIKPSIGSVSSASLRYNLYKYADDIVFGTTFTTHSTDTSVSYIYKLINDNDLGSRCGNAESTSLYYDTDNQQNNYRLRVFKNCPIFFFGYVSFYTQIDTEENIYTATFHEFNIGYELKDLETKFR